MDEMRDLEVRHVLALLGQLGLQRPHLLHRLVKLLQRAVLVVVLRLCEWRGELDT